MPRGVHNGHRANSGSFNNWDPEKRAEMYRKRSESDMYIVTRPGEFLNNSQEKATQGKRLSEKFKENSRIQIARLRSNPDTESKRKLKSAEGLRGTLWGRTRSIPTDYAGIHFRSLSEAQLAQWMDRVGWSWVYEPRAFPYKDATGKVRHYLPDFYVLSEDLYIEVKGYRYEGLKEFIREIELLHDVRFEILTSAEIRSFHCK